MLLVRHVGKQGQTRLRFASLVSVPVFQESLWTFAMEMPCPLLPEGDGFARYGRFIACGQYFLAPKAEFGADGRLRIVDDGL